MDILAAAPPYFDQILLGFVIAAFGVAVALGIFTRDGIADPESTFLWMKPVVVAVSIASLYADTFGAINSALLFGLTFALGLACGGTSWTEMRVGRDYALSLVAFAISVLLIVQRVAPAGAYAVIYLVLLAALAMGAAIGGVSRFTQPIGGMALLGGVLMLDFLVSPFGYSMFGFDGPSQLFVGVAGAAMLGFMFRLKPLLTLYLGSATIQVTGVALPALIYFAHRSERETFPFLADWTGAIALAGCATGYALGRLPFVLTRVV